MKKILIIISGIYITVVGFLVGIAMFLPFLMMWRKSYSLPKNFQAPLLLFTFIPSGATFLLVFLTGIGIILRKIWSRYLLFVLSYLALFVGISSLTVFVLTSLVSDDSLISKIFVFTPMVVFLIVIPLFFIIFFSMKSTAKLFLDNSSGTRLKKRPMGITLLAVFEFIGFVSHLILAIKPSLVPSMPILGLEVYNIYALKSYYIIMTIVSVFVAFNLLRLRKSGWITFILLKGFLIINGLITILVFDQDMLNKAILVANKNFVYSLAMFRTFGLLGILFQAIILWYVFSKKKIFFNGNTFEKVQPKSGSLYVVTIPVTLLLLTVFSVLFSKAFIMDVKIMKKDIPEFGIKKGARVLYYKTAYSFKLKPGDSIIYQPKYDKDYSVATLINIKYNLYIITPPSTKQPDGIFLNQIKGKVTRIGPKKYKKWW